MTSNKVKVMVAFPLAEELAEKIAALDPRVELMYAPHLLGTPRYATDHAPPVERTADEESGWQEMLAQAEVIFGFDYSHLDDLLDLTPSLRWLQGTSTGIGMAVKRFGWDQSDIVFTTARGVHSGPLAEFCLMVMLMFVKDAFRMAAEKERKHWQRYAGTTLKGKTLAVISLGDGGQAVARRARCLGMNVIGTKRTIEGIESASLGVEMLYAWTDLKPMLAQADFVVLYLPHTAETEGLIGKAELAAMKPGAVLINVARGAVWDEAAVIEALESGHLGGLASDVFAVEPLPADSPLWDMPNVVISPHSASAAANENAKVTEVFCENLARYLDGQPLLNVLDTERLY